LEGPFYFQYANSKMKQFDMMSLISRLEVNS